MLLAGRAMSTCVYALFVLCQKNVASVGPRNDMEEVMLFELEGFLSLIPDASSRELELLKEAAVYELKEGPYLVDIQAAKKFVGQLAEFLEYVGSYEEVYEFFENVLKEAGSPVLLSDIRVAHGS